MSIQYEEETKLFHLNTQNSTYQMKIDEIGILHHNYYGAPVGNMDMSYQFCKQDRGFSGNPYEKGQDRGYSLDLIPQEYTSAGVGDYRVSSISLITENGSRSVDFRYVSHTIEKGKYTIPGLPAVRRNQAVVDTLRIQMRDVHNGLGINLFYGVYEDLDIITRTVEIMNNSTTTVYLEKAASVCMDFMHQKFDLLHFHGRHCMERQPERVSLTHDIHTIGSRRGMSSHHHNPFVILCDSQTTEMQGECYGFMLMYSGNFKTEIEVDQVENTRLVMGLQDENFRWTLTPGKSFYAPETILSFSSNGLNALSQQYHRVIRENICAPKYLHERRPVLINNWEATYFDFNTDKILNLAKQASELGIEMFVLDDGWFGKRNNDDAGLGDWFVNEEKLPGGLKQIADNINAQGMKFGLWFEPEMVNEDSKLFQQHPDWALCDPERKPMLSRNQLVLDMANPEVIDYLFDSMSKVLKSANISYVKWDFNRSIANVYSNAHEFENQGEVSHRFILGTYELLDRLIKSFPDILFEGCAGGGGRFDAGMLYFCPQIWCSDDTDPIARLTIQKGTSYGYPVSSMGSHVSIAPNHQTGRTTSIDTRAIVAMSGTFGYELDLNKVSAEEKQKIQEQIIQFKKYYWLIQSGLYYRLTELENHLDYEAWEHVSSTKDECLVSLVATDVHANAKSICIRLKGLKPEGIYQLEGTKEIYTGAALMRGGYVFPGLEGDYPAIQLHFTEME